MLDRYINYLSRNPFRRSIYFKRNNLDVPVSTSRSAYDLSAKGVRVRIIVPSVNDKEVNILVRFLRTLGSRAGGGVWETLRSRGVDILSS